MRHHPRARSQLPAPCMVASGGKHLPRTLRWPFRYTISPARQLRITLMLDRAAERAVGRLTEHQLPLLYFIDLGQELLQSGIDQLSVALGEVDDLTHSGSHFSKITFISERSPGILVTSSGKSSGTRRTILAMVLFLRG